MTTITIDELTRNAVLAALDERAARLEHEVTNLNLTGVTGQDHDRALVWNIAALHETNMARLQIGEAEATPPEQSDPITAAKAESDREYHPWQSSAAAEAVR